MGDATGGDGRGGVGPTGAPISAVQGPWACGGRASPAGRTPAQTASARGVFVGGGQQLEEPRRARSGGGLAWTVQAALRMTGARPARQGRRESDGADHVRDVRGDRGAVTVPGR